MNIKSLFRKGTEGKQQEEQAPSPATAKKKKRRRKWIILGVILVVIAALLVNCSLQAQKMASMFSLSDTVVLTRSDIESTVGATGTVESADSHTVYSTQNYPVKAVHVEVGDVVQEGDLLCELDASALEDQIEAQELSTGISAQAAAQQVKTARDNYNATKEALDEGLNTGIISAENNVRATYDAWQKAVRTYETYEDSLDDDTNATLIQYDNAVDTAQKIYDTANGTYLAAKTSADTAQTAYTTAVAAKNEKQALVDQAQTAYANALSAYNADPSAENQAALTAAEGALEAASADLAAANALVQSAQADLESKQTAYNSAYTAWIKAKNDLDTAKAQRRSAYENADTTLSDYARAVDTARDNYNAALVSLEAARQSAKTQLQSNKNALSSAEINGNTDSAVLKLAQMQEDLEETRMTANANGTVTAVYAKVGANGAGLMFVIEDVGNLIVKTSVSGYDIGNVTVGMPVTIKSDATGDTVINGKVNTIAPTSEKNAQGQTNTTGDVLFDTEVAVLDKNTGLRIGMSARLKYIVEQQSGVIAVPFDALYEKEDGQSYVLAAIPQTDGKYLLKEIAVTQGLENDLDVVITGDGVEEGLRILTNPGNFRALIGREITAMSDDQEQALRRFGLSAARG